MFDYRGNTDTCLYAITDEACCYLIMLSRCNNIKLCSITKILYPVFDNDDDNTIKCAAIQNCIADRCGLAFISVRYAEKLLRKENLYQ